ncbi:PE-PPE domain-containing protein [Lentzea albidocapillata]|uniref:PE-PPE domain-containing protein n=1 Tax=Lentzea albidocapillata TaxID=40571 RepID=UPI0015A4422C|nr:PE-PPE domain-containing protein [Lentzea albidocapillata]
MLGYQAPAVATLFENSGFFSAPREMIERNVPRYLEGKNVGVERLREVVRKSQQDCLGQAVALAGYSQGALVIHQFLQEAVSGDAVVRDDNTKVFDFGTAANKSMGMCQLLLPVVQCVAPNVLADVPAVFRPVTTSVSVDRSGVRHEQPDHLGRPRVDHERGQSRDDQHG